MAECYNAEHEAINEELETKTKNGKKLNRDECYKQRLADAIYLYMLLDISKRRKLKLEFGPTISETISKNHELIVKSFEAEWALHQCDVKGCSPLGPRVLIFDGAQKINRQVLL